MSHFQSTVWCSKLVLVDSLGVPRIELLVDEYDRAIIRLSDAKGRTKTGVSVDHFGLVAGSIHDEPMPMQHGVDDEDVCLADFEATVPGVHNAT